MNISQLGGEFELIKRLTSKKIKDKNIIKGVGDDCAVLKYTKDKYLLLTTDMMSEDNHFSTKWYTPMQIGMKLMEINVSDIVSMGGTPKFVIVSICLKNNTPIKFIDELYNGLNKSAKKHGVLIVGGDTISGKEYVFNLALIGEVKKSMLRLRSGARVGDLICVTGKLGGSTAGLELLRRTMNPPYPPCQGGRVRFPPDRGGRGGGRCIRKHLEPKSRTTKEGQIIAKYAGAMIDVSDGLGAEVKHICEESKTGARIDFDKIPLSKVAIVIASGGKGAKPLARGLAPYPQSADKPVLNPYDLALYGGEDFEIVFTISRNNLAKLKKKFKDFSIVGEILNRKEGVFILKNGEKNKVKNGYSHFK